MERTGNDGRQTPQPPRSLRGLTALPDFPRRLVASCLFARSVFSRALAGRRRALTVALVGSLVAGAAGVGCAARGLQGAVFVKPEVRYRVGLPRLAPDGPWRATSLPGNDAAWAGPDGLVLAVNATCDRSDDAPLEVLTRHVLMGFTEREEVSSAIAPLDGREALRTGWAAKLDGVPVDIELAVLKKNGCVHDFTAIAPRGRRAAAQEALAALLGGFAQEWRR